MPWTPKQHRLFQAAAHNPALAKQKGIPVAKAAMMASEGIKSPLPGRKPGRPRIHPQTLADVLTRMK
jgi:hypothetical protein